MKVQKILIATPLYPPQIGGPASYTRALETELPKHGVAITVVKFSDFNKHPPIIRHLAYYDSVRAGASDADIIYAQDPLGVGFPAMLAARSLGKRFFLKVVGDRAWEEEQRVRPSMIDVIDFQTRSFGLMTNLRRYFERMVAKRAERVIVPSVYLQKVVLMWGVAPERISVVPNGIPEFSFPDRDVARQKVGAYTSPFFVSIGRLSPWKGFPALISAMARVRSRVQNARLVIIGSGTEKERQFLEQEIARHHLEQSVSLVGSLPREEVCTYLSACDAFVLNTFYEGFSHQILEAMASGATIVTTNAGGNAELLHEGKNAYIVPYNNDNEFAEVLIRIVQDPTKAREMGDEAKKQAAAYTEARMVKEFLSVL